MLLIDIFSLVNIRLEFEYVDFDRSAIQSSTLGTAYRLLSGFNTVFV